MEHTIPITEMKRIKAVIQEAYKEPPAEAAARKIEQYQHIRNNIGNLGV